MSPASHGASREGAAIRTAALWCALLLAATPAAPRAQDAGHDLAAALRTIQNVCFASYPEDMVARMAARPGPAPATVRDDPREQIRYLKTEEVVEKGLFYPSLLEDLLPAFQAFLRPGARFLDLGSGDGRVVFLAALLGAQATGIEYERRLHNVAVEARRGLAGLIDTERATLKRGDFFRDDWGRYDVVFYYLSGSVAEPRIGVKLAREMRPAAVFLVLAGEPKHFPDLEPAAVFGPVRVFRRPTP